MNKIKLYKAGIDFALANLDVTDAVALAENSIAAFKAGGFNSLDLALWNQTVTQARQQFTQLQNQKLPSEVAAQQEAAKAPMPAAAPVETKAA